MSYAAWRISFQSSEQAARSAYDQLAARDAEIAELRKDAERLNYMETLCMAYGFQDIHEGNSWKIKGPFATLRMAIDADIAIALQGEK